MSAQSLLGDQECEKKKIIPLPFRSMTLLTQYYHPEPGAASIRLRALVSELTKRGVKIRVITGMPNYPEGRFHPGFGKRLWQHDAIDGVPVLRLWLYPAAGRRPLRRILNYISFTCMAFFAMMTQKLGDVVFVEAQPITLALPAWFASLFRRTPYIYNTPDLQVEYAKEGRWGIGALLSRWAASLEAFLMRKSVSVSTVTHGFMRYFAENRSGIAQRLTFLPNGVDPEIFRPLPYDIAMAKEVQAEHKKVFVYSGVLASYHGVNVLIDAAIRLRNDSEILIVINGMGPERQALESRVLQESLTNVHFSDYPAHELSRLMSIAEAGLATMASHEVTKLMRLAKILPYSATGKPVVFAGWGESADLIVANGSGIVSPPGDDVAFAASIKELAYDGEHTKRMGRSAREAVIKKYQWSQIIDAWLLQLRPLFTKH